MDSITSFEQALQKLPSEFRSFMRMAWDNYQAALVQQECAMPLHSDFIPSLSRVWASSDFVIKNCIRHPKMLFDLFTSGDILLEYPKGEYANRLNKLLKPVTNIEDLMVALRCFRRREMVRIAWRALSKWATTIKTLNDLSALADIIISQTNHLLYQWLGEKKGFPSDEKSGRKLPMQILAMGKLGAYELNFSSDVDLIYCYPQDGELESGMSYQKFYIQLAQQLTKTLNTVTGDGFVFRVDLRLRPYGTSGALVYSYKAIEEYYKTHGRDWERYALIKARVINYNKSFTPPLLHLIHHFVYRDYIDFSAIESLRGLQMKINSEVKKHGLENNIKRGAGGIREIEFIAQTHKIIQGGKYFRLQERNTIKSLILLREAGTLSSQSTRQLNNAYLFLRKLENRLQMLNDAQTHSIPESALTRHRIAYAMGYINWQNLDLNLKRQRQIVHDYFEELIAQPSLEFSDPKVRTVESEMQALWSKTLIADELSEILNRVGFSDATSITPLIINLKDYVKQQKISKSATHHVGKLLPHLLALIATTQYPDLVFRRMLPLIEAIVEHSAYLILLFENPIVLSQAVNLCAASPWIANQLATYPLLLDQLLDAKTLYAPPNLSLLKQLLNNRLNAVVAQPLETQFDIIRSFKQEHVLRVAAVDVTGILPLMRVSDYLTDIATVVVNKIRDLCLQELVNLHGSPSLPYDYKQAGFCIVAYGKLGGIELGYTSDLDLVFLHPKMDGQAMTEGDSPITNLEFFTRLGRNIVKVLTQTSAKGFLYKADLRLRPSGNSGLLVNSVTAFADYQSSTAWCWEHQALVRSRPICGSPRIGVRFEKIRSKILSKPRQIDELKFNVKDMREKMRQSKLQRKLHHFDLKQGFGGLVDIEFIAQFVVLASSHEYPSLLQYPDNVRIFERAGMEGIVRMKDIRLLTEAYKAYRSHLHQAALQDESVLISDDRFQFYRIGVMRIWEQLIG